MKNLTKQSLKYDSNVNEIFDTRFGRRKVKSYKFGWS